MLLIQLFGVPQFWFRVERFHFFNFLRITWELWLYLFLGICLYPSHHSKPIDKAMECGLAWLFFFYYFYFFLSLLCFLVLFLFVFVSSFLFFFLVSFFLGYPVSVRQQFLELLEWEEFCPANIPPHLDISHPEFYPPTFHLLRISYIRNSVRQRSTSFGYLTSGILSADIPPPPDILHPKFCPSTFHFL